MFKVVPILLSVAVLSAACGTDRNQAPSAELSADKTEVAVGEQVTLDGTASADPDGDPLLFRWSVDAPQGSSVDVSNHRTRNLTLKPDAPGTYTVRLSVDDGEFESPQASVSLEATGTGAPVADAGDDQSVEVGAEVTLDGTASSDPNGDELTYQWSFQQIPQQSTAELDDPSAATPTFVADVGGEYIVALVVSDGTHDSEPDTVIISAGGDNLPPQADAGEDQTADVGREVVLDGSGSTDPDSADLTYFWAFVSRPDGSNAAIQDATTDTARFVPDAEGTYEIELEVSDEASVDTDTVVVTAETSVSTSCLLISEYLEGSGNNKAIEVYNCDDSTLDLTNFGVCIVSNTNTTCTNYDIPLSGELAADEVLTLCNPGLDTAVFDPADCDVVDSSVNFNGNDRIVIYDDMDASDDFSASDLPVDVFGEIANGPSSAAWADTTLRRCDFTRLDGASGFDFTQYFAEFAADDFSDFGEPPVEGCP